MSSDPPAGKRNALEAERHEHIALPRVHEPFHELGSTRWQKLHREPIAPQTEAQQLRHARGSALAVNQHAPSIRKRNDSGLERVHVKPFERAVEILALLAQKRPHIARSPVDACAHLIRRPQRPRRDRGLQRLEIREARMPREPRHGGIRNPEPACHLLDGLKQKLLRALDDVVHDELFSRGIGHARGEERRIGHARPYSAPAMSVCT